jgi:hypothetical protein
MQCQWSTRWSTGEVFKGDTVQNSAFDVNGNQIEDEQDAIRYAHAIANESGRSVIVWEQDTGLPFAWIAPDIKIRRVTV